MRVVFLTNFIPPSRKQLYQIISQKIPASYILLSTDMEKNRLWEVNHDGLEVKIQKSISYRKMWKHESGYEDYTEVHFPYDTIYQLIKIKPNVVVSAELGMRSLFSAIYCRLSGVPLILWLTLSEHTESNKKGLRILLRKLLIKSADAILVNGKSAHSYIKRLGASCPFFYVPYTSDFELKRLREDFSAIKKKFLYSGQLIPRKGIKEMIEELCAWASKNTFVEIELFVAGSGPEKIYFSKLDRFSNIVYHLLGDIKYEELSKCYEEVDFYLFPTLGDEWGVVVNEALASGIPVLGSIYSQAVLELIENDRNGWQYDPLKKGELSKLLNKAVNITPHKLKRMSKYSLEVVGEITAEKVSSTIVSAIQTVT